MLVVNGTSLTLVLLVLLISPSVLLVAICALLSTMVSLGCFLRVAGRLLDYRLSEQLRDLCPALLCGMLMGLAVQAVGQLSLPPLGLLGAQIGTGAVVYGALAKGGRLEAMEFLLSLKS